MGRLEEARALYFAHKGKVIPQKDNKFWEDVIAEDFDTLHAAGIDHSAFGEIVAALGINPAQSREHLDTLKRQIDELDAGGKSAEALPIAEKYIAAASERYGEDHPAYATAINNLALHYQAQGRYPEAEPLYKRALTICEKALGPEHPSVGQDGE